MPEGKARDDLRGGQRLASERLAGTWLATAGRSSGFPAPKVSDRFGLPSASTAITSTRCLANAVHKAPAIVVFPTPPLPETTTLMPSPSRIGLAVLSQGSRSPSLPAARSIIRNGHAEQVGETKAIVERDLTQHDPIQIGQRSTSDRRRWRPGLVEDDANSSASLAAGDPRQPAASEVCHLGAVDYSNEEIDERDIGTESPAIARVPDSRRSRRPARACRKGPTSWRAWRAIAVLPLPPASATRTGVSVCRTAKCQGHIGANLPGFHGEVEP